MLDDIQLKIFQYCNKIEPRYIPKIEVVEYQGVNLVYLKCAAGDAGPYQAPVDVYSKKEAGKEQDRTMKYWIRPALLTVEAKRSEIAELFEKFTSIPFVDRINNRVSMEHMRRGYFEDFIRESNSALIEELNVRSLEDLLVSEEVAEEKDEGIAIKNIGLLMFGERPDKLIAEVTAFQGMSQEDFVAYMSRFMQEEKPDFPGLSYEDCFYKPMLELIQYLQDNDFTVYIVSGSERGVIWGAASEAVNLPRSQMIGADITLAATGDKSASEASKPYILEPDDTLDRELGFTQRSLNMSKVYNIFRQIGIRPIFACGNTDGDFSMLNYAKYNPDHAGIAFLINHDDDVREYRYNTSERAERDALADQYGWHVISMKNEFDTVFLKDAEKVTE